jgi:hypothetical protein
MLGGGAGAATAPASATADLVISGGPIYTADDAHPTAEAVAVKDGRILYVGDAAGAKALTGKTTRKVDLKGSALYPGFTDSHAHLDGVGEREMTLNLEGSKSAAEVVQRLKARLASAKPGEVVFGRGWIETGWPEGRFLNAADLDAVSPNNPVLMERADGHAIVANTVALKIAKVTEETKAPDGGAILKDKDGHLTGMFVDHAMSLIRPVIPPRSHDHVVKALTLGMEVENRYGWTGVHFMSASWEDVLALEDLDAKGQAPLRVYAAVDREYAPDLFKSGPRATADGRITTRAIKLYADGALGSRGAALMTPYSDDAPNVGLILLSPDDTRAILKEAKAKGVQICTHAIGDRGNAVILDLYQETLGAGDDARWRIEHAQHLRPDDIGRMARLKVIASMQPSHAIGDLHFAPQRLGEARLYGAYAWASLEKAGAVVTGGSDAPVERGDPLIEYYAAVARKDLKGYSASDWHPDEALSRTEALKLFTKNAAYARFAEKDLGTIEVGKRADLTGFSVDLIKAPEADIPKGHAVLTVVDGKVVFEKL